MNKLIRLWHRVFGYRRETTKSMTIKELYRHLRHWMFLNPFSDPDPHLYIGSSFSDNLDCKICKRKISKFQANKLYEWDED